MPIYRFTAVQGDNACPDVRWAHLKDEEAARHLCKIAHAKVCCKEALYRSRSLASRCEGPNRRTAVILSSPGQRRVAIYSVFESCLSRVSDYHPLTVRGRGGPDFRIRLDRRNPRRFSLAGSNVAASPGRDRRDVIRWTRIELGPVLCGDAQYRHASVRN
jgi:hypothetical protein